MFNKIEYFFRRAAAYAIDILLVSIVVNCFVSSDKVNFQLNSYNEYFSEYSKLYISYYEHQYYNSEIDTCDEFKTAIDTYKLTEEEYVSKFEKLNTSLNDEEISKEEYEKACLFLINEYQEDGLTNKEYKEKESNYVYHLEKNYIVAYIINSIVIILYFVLFQGFTYGQTLGKKIFRLKVVKDNGERVSYKRLFLRSILLFSVIYYVLEILAVLVLPPKYFSTAYEILLFLNSALSFIIIISILANKDNKGLHGSLSKTKVILIDLKGNEVDIKTGIAKKDIEALEKKLDEEKHNIENKK